LLDVTAECRLKITVKDGQQARANLYRSVTATLVHSMEAAAASFKLRVQPDADDAAALVLEDADARLTKAGKYYVKGTHKEERYEVSRRHVKVHCCCCCQSSE
jgi:hypothetical protein